VAVARGVVLGLVLGGAIGATGGNVPDTGPLVATSGGQLACFTVEGLIRAHVRAMHHGIRSAELCRVLGQPGVEVGAESSGRPAAGAVSRRGSARQTQPLWST
jgi:hypothetical protein